jgi:hypothetical protein
MPFHSLYSNIFSNKHHHADEGTMLAELTERYPYFSLAHFFLLKNTEENSPAYNQVAAKTALHFNNPFLLHEQLHQLPPQNQDVLHPPTFTPEPQPAVDVLPVAEIAATDDLNDLAETTQPAEIILQEEIGQDIGPVAEEPENRTGLPSNNDAVIEEVNSDKEVVEIPVEVIRDETPVLQEVVIAENAPGEKDLSSPVADPAVVAHLTPERPDMEAPLFEPLSASDYFASQGIKFTEEQQPTDRMGKQLKSFTAWLKTMKKVHDNKLPGVEGTVDLAVQTLAEKSNKEEDILTEAMAEVYLQQGKSNKAKEIYEKLSLLNPAKSAYFAAKLEQIK